MVSPAIIKGGRYRDFRGSLFYNNDFDLLTVKRIYLLENADVSIKRGWQGHKVEQRWFSAVQGEFEIRLIQVDDWEQPSRNLKEIIFVLESATLDVLHVPSGYITLIQAKANNSKLLVMADYALGEIVDEYRYDCDYFQDQNIEYN